MNSSQVTRGIEQADMQDGPKKYTVRSSIVIPFDPARVSHKLSYSKPVPAVLVTGPIATQNPFSSLPSTAG